jgi:hypothetical protein
LSLRSTPLESFLTRMSNVLLMRAARRVVGLAAYRSSLSHVKWRFPVLADQCLSVFISGKFCFSDSGDLIRRTIKKARQAGPSQVS